MAKVKTHFEESDVLIVGGGMAGTGATFEARHWGKDLKIVCEDFPPLFNQYGIILVNSELNKNLNYDDAKKYIDWFKTSEVKELINNFKAKGKQLFYYNYN